MESLPKERTINTNCITKILLQKYILWFLVDAYAWPVAMGKRMETGKYKSICMKHTVDKFCEVAFS
jgi:hypothetical protein